MAKILGETLMILLKIFGHISVTIYIVIFFNKDFLALSYDINGSVIHYCYV